MVLGGQSIIASSRFTPGIADGTPEDGFCRRRSLHEPGRVVEFVQVGPFSSDFRLQRAPLRGGCSLGERVTAGKCGMPDLLLETGDSAASNDCLEVF